MNKKINDHDLRSSTSQVNAAERAQKTKLVVNSQITPKQWSVFHAVVACGSYANAAEVLRITQPAVSYIITRLEEQVGFPLLKVEGRKAKITENGVKLLRRSQPLLREARELEMFIEELRQSRHTRIKLAVNEQFPSKILFGALRAYHQQGHEPPLTLIQGHREKIGQVLQERMADLAIDDHVPHGFHGELLMELDFLPVAHPHHHFFSRGGVLTQSDLGEEIQLVYEPGRNYCPNTYRPHPGSGNIWLLSSDTAVLNALAEGIGYGWLPSCSISEAVARGKLKVLRTEERTKKSKFYLVHDPSFEDAMETCHVARVLRNAIENHVMTAMDGPTFALGAQQREADGPC
jgi:DNA-binding transcriptional LysR family regulator